MADKRVAFWLLSIHVLSTTVVGSLGFSADSSVQSDLIDRIIALEKQGQHHAEEMQTMKSRFKEQDQKLVNQDMVISDYKQRLEVQDQKLVNQDRTITDNKQRLEEQDNRLAVQGRAISDYKQKVADLEQTVVELKLRKDQSAEGPVESNAGNIRQTGPAHSNFRKATEGQMRALLNAEGPVAFHAVITAAEVTHLGVNQKLVFPVVQTNLGGGYHNQHGLFIAPEPGVYIFSTSIMSDNKGHVALGVNIMKNGHILARAWGHGDAGYSDQGSVTVVTQLAAADEVWISISGPADTSLWGGYYSSFMGCLVVPL